MTKFQVVLAAAGALLIAGVPSPAQGDETNKWSFDLTLYGLAAAMSGDVGIGPVNTTLDVDFADIVENLEFGAMTKFRVGYDRWSFSTDVIYMGLGGSKDNFSADVDQWTVEPSFGYRVCPGVEVLAGVRYNNIKAEIRGVGPFGVARARSDTEEWFDPIVGANLSYPLGQKFSLTMRGDIGGFGVGSDLTWQAFPGIQWHVSRVVSLQAGYRWVDTDYETGSGASRFKYDVLTEGPQLGVTIRF